MTKKDDVLRAIFERRSIRRYSAEAVPKQLIDALLEAAIWAPSAHNRQPWRFVVVTNDATKVKLATNMGAKLRHDLEADSVPEAIIAKDVNRSYDRITSAPVLILVALTLEDMDVYRDELRNHHEWTMAVQSTAMAAQNLLLAAQTHGLGACWMCAPLFCPTVVCHSLSLPEKWQPQALITLGYPAQTRTKTRHSVQTRSIYIE